MAVITYLGTDYTVDHAVKGADFIHGYDANAVMIVSFEGISDFSLYSYNGTYMAPDHCLAEGCNTVKHVDGELKKADGTVIQLQSGINPNILHNWYFGNPVNQRGKTNYSGAVYGIDRWKSTNANLSLAVADGYITLDASAGASYFRQFFEVALPNRSITISALARGTGQLSHYLTNSSGTSGVETIQRSDVDTNEWELFSATYSTANLTTEIGGATLAVSAGGLIDLLAVKLEYGTQQTLAHQENGMWVLNEIPDYGEQLALCQRYFQSLRCNGYGFSLASGEAINCHLPTPVSFRTIPVRTNAVEDIIIRKGGSDITGASVGIVMSYGDSEVRVKIVPPSGESITARDMYNIFSDEDMEVQLSADL